MTSRSSKTVILAAASLSDSLNRFPPYLSSIDDGGLQRAVAFDTTDLRYDLYDSYIYFNEEQFVVHTLLDE